MATPDPAAKEKKPELTPDPTKKADELTAQELEAVVGGRDAATGLATGKRQHKPITGI